jgi:isoleucyl-tRNA synthetase
VPLRKAAQNPVHAGQFVLTLCRQKAKNSYTGMYKEYKQLDLPGIDREILQFWESASVFERSIAQRDAANSFVFYEGPPSANGMPGIHHVMARTVKDVFCRYQTLKGRRVERKGGWDTHGLPIELQVEKELGITKEDIGHKITVDEYNQACRSTVMRYKDVWDRLTHLMGYWVDLEHPYVTFHNEYIETVWFLLKRLYDKGYLYKGYTIQPYSPAAGTGLSTHELNQPGTYQDVTDTTAVGMFKLIRNEDSAWLFEDNDEDVRILAWTTTPWTLPSNTALAVGPDIQYVKIRTHNPYTKAVVSVVLAEALVSKWLGGKNQPEAEGQSAPFAGSRLSGLRYEQLLPYVQPAEGDAFRVITGDFVTTEDGTGIVHIAPSFGADDMKVARQHGIGSLTLVDRQGKFTDEVGEFAGRYVKNYKNEADYQSVDVDIAIKLKTEGKAFNVQKYVHAYPHCWRTDKPILYYPLDSWFVAASRAKERMFELNKTISWKPAATGEGRFGKWLENLQDWNLSRSRYWGIPLPIWRNADGSLERCIGSMAELREAAAATAALLQAEAVSSRLTAAERAAIAEGCRLVEQPTFDLHRPYIDQLILLSEDGQPMYRETDLVDVWFDSGSMPYAQWGLDLEKLRRGDDRPFKQPFDKSYPADFIAEGVDQTRGWFYTLHAIAVMCFDSVAYRNVVSNGLVLDKQGNKMSKSKGNIVDPFSTLNTYGADATRWYMLSNAQPWDNLKFDLDGVMETRNKLFGTLYNTYNFFAMYANLDNWVMDEQGLIAVAERPELDRWIISKLNSLVAAYGEAMDDYEPTKAARLIETFVDEHLSNWYVRLSRRRFWRGELSADKVAAYQTLYECLTVTSQLIASLAPFFGDWLYRNLTEPVRAQQGEREGFLYRDSVHLTDLAKAVPAHIDLALEKRMDYAQRICSLAFSIRKKEKIRVRQPLSTLLLPVLDASFIAEVSGVKELIQSEINVKQVEYLTDASGLLKKSAKANFKTLGSKLGKDMKEVAARIAGLSNEEINALEKTGSLSMAVDDKTYEIGPEDILVSTEDLPGLKTASDGELTVALDLALSEELLAEGTARDLVNRIQNLRKELDLNITDRIRVAIEQHPAVVAAVTQFGDYIRGEVLAEELAWADSLPDNQVELSDEVSLGIRVHVL